MNKKMQLVMTVAMLTSSTLASARENAPYPSENLAQFVVEKLDVTSLPSAYRPKKEKGKKTLTDYGYSAQKLEEKEAFLEQPVGARYLSIKILQESDTGIYACVAVAEDGADPKLQSVMLLKRKGASALLKGRESGKKFTSCHAIGEEEAESAFGAY